jgi:hypothetical protein
MMPINIADLSSDIKIQPTLFLNVSTYGNSKGDELLEKIYYNLKAKHPELFLVINNCPLCVLNNNMSDAVSNVIDNILSKYMKYPVKQNNKKFKNNFSEDVKPLILYQMNTYGNIQYPKVYKDLYGELLKNFPNTNIVIETNTLNLSHPNKYLFSVTNILNDTFREYWK